MTETTDTLENRIVITVLAAGVSRAAVEFEWPECHKNRCQGKHGSVDAALGIMKHSIVDAIKAELRARATSAPDVAEDSDSPSEAAKYTLAALLSTFARAGATHVASAALMLDAYPDLATVLAEGGVEAIRAAERERVAAHLDEMLEARGPHGQDMRRPSNFGRAAREVRALGPVPAAGGAT